MQKFSRIDKEWVEIDFDGWDGAVVWREIRGINVGSRREFERAVSAMSHKRVLVRFAKGLRGSEFWVDELRSVFVKLGTEVVAFEYTMATLPAGGGPFQNRIDLDAERSK